MRHVFTLLIVQVFLLQIPSSAQFSDEELSDANIEDLMRVFLDVKMELELLKIRIQTLEQQSDTGASTSSGAAQWPGVGLDFDEREETNRADLRAIKFPDYPTESSIRAYITEIGAASHNQNTWSTDDPQVQMLARVGPEYAHLLIDSAATDSMFSLYTIEAIKQTVTVDQKEMILERLPYEHNLVEIILHRNWLDEARSILIRELNEGTRLPTEWYRAIALLNDRATYDSLIEHFVRGPHHSSIYYEIAELPKIYLDDAVSQVWESEQLVSFSREQMAPIALAFGYLDALEIMLKDLSSPLGHGPRGHSARQFVLRYTEASGSNSGLRAWFELNRERLVFDFEQKKFRAP